MQAKQIDIEKLSSLDKEIVQHLHLLIQAFEGHGQEKMIKLCREQIELILEKYR